jgi:hypothetical protein
MAVQMAFHARVVETSAVETTRAMKNLTAQRQKDHVTVSHCNTTCTSLYRVAAVTEIQLLNAEQKYQSSSTRTKPSLPDARRVYEACDMGGLRRA